MGKSKVLESTKRAMFWGIMFVCLAVAIVLVIQYQFSKDDDIPKAVNGVIDFQDLDFSTSQHVVLSGQAEFYWKQLLTPNDFQNRELSEQVFLDIPGKWNDLVENGQKVGAKGYGTYKLTILVPDNKSYGLKIKEFESAFKLWINGELVGGAGEVGTTKALMQPSRKRKEYYFTPVNKQIDIVLQVSNFQHRRGGASKPVLLGYAQSIKKYKHHRLGVDCFLFGVLVILILYFLVFNLNRQKDLSALYFSLLCIVMLLRLGTTGEKILLELFSWLPYSIAMRIEYASFIAIAPFSCYFIRELFPKEISLIVVKWVGIISFAFIAFVVVAPVLWFTYTPLVFQILSLIPLVYFPVALFIAIIRGREFAILTFGSIILFYIFVGNDYLYYNKLAESAYLMPFGIFIFAISQAIVLSQKRLADYRRIELLSEELRNSNILLEDRVAQRTKKISEQKERIEEQNNSLERKNDKLLKLANFKKDMTQMMVHDLKSPLNNIIGFSEEDDVFQASREFINSSGWQLQNLITNILDVDKYEISQIKLNTESLQLAELVNEAFEFARFLIELKNIRFENAISPSVSIVGDKQILQRIFANLFSNAAKYGSDNGLIRISSEKVEIENKTFLKVKTYNSGEPISSDKIDEIFAMYTQLHNVQGDFNYSTGIGLAYCKMAILAHGGQIGAKTGRTEGVSIWFTMPVDC